MQNQRLALFVVLTGLLLVVGGYTLDRVNNLAGRTSKDLAALPTPHLGQFDPINYEPKVLQELIEKRDDVIILDVRSKEEYDKGHIPGAIHADYYDDKKLAQIVGDRTPITYCTYSTWRAPYAAYQLYKQGYDNVGIVEGGITRWSDEINELASSLGGGIIAKKPDLPYPPGAGENISETENVVEIDLIARKFEFEPATIKVEQGQKVILNISSIDVAHGFVLPEFGINEVIPAGETVTVEFITDQIGTFPFVCSVYCGEDHTRMVGDVVVN